MVEALLVVAIGLGVLCFRRLGVVLRRDEESHVYLEARLEDRIRSRIEETAASVTGLSDSLLAQLTQTRLAIERKLDALATQVGDASLSSEKKLEALASQIVEASRIRGEALDAIDRQIGEEAQRTRRELAEAVESLKCSLDQTLGEMRALRERAVRELQRPIRHAVAIRQEIRRARDQQAKPAREPPVRRSEVAEAIRLEDEIDQILVPERAGEGPALLDATHRGGVARPTEAPDGPVRHPLEPEKNQPQLPVAAPPTRRLAGLLSRMQRRNRRAASARADTQVGH